MFRESDRSHRHPHPDREGLGPIGAALVVVLLAAGGLSLTACGEDAEPGDGAAENAGEEIDAAAEETGEALEEAAEETEEGLEEAARQTGEALEETGAEIEEAAEE